MDDFLSEMLQRVFVYAQGGGWVGVRVGGVVVTPLCKKALLVCAGWHVS